MDAQHPPTLPPSRALRGFPIKEHVWRVKEGHKSLTTAPMRSGSNFLFPKSGLTFMAYDLLVNKVREEVRV